jgi:hypothetical protein
MLAAGWRLGERPAHGTCGEEFAGSPAVAPPRQRNVLRLRPAARTGLSQERLKPFHNWRKFAEAAGAIAAPARIVAPSARISSFPARPLQFRR